ncbi:MAG: glycosyltransferase family 2 protein, partial [Pseudorhodobacter sp.]|nr:glycosyltransferase family 2 protein [Frankiaceae bacterium]
MTAVLVAHDGERWLPETLAALQTSTRVPAAVVCVDTGSTDGSAALLERAHGSVVQLPRDTGFPAAVAAGLAQGPRSTWIWLLHDDCAVEPGTLQALLEQAEQTPSAVLLGAKARDWSDPRVLVEVGVTTDSAGHRETGLERREYDQGQHDAVRDVLAVGTAGALVRRDVWDTLGGLDPALPVSRDDLDLGWRVNAAGHRVLIVPAATVRHARAATTGHRQTEAAPGRATATDRRNALWVLLAHASLVRLLGLVPRLLLGTVLHALSLLLTRQVTAAGDEVRALAGVLSHPVRLRRARARRAATRTVSQRDLRPLFAHRSNRLRARVGALGDRLSGGSAIVSVLGDPGAEGPDELVDLGSGGSGTLRRLLLRPGTLLVLTLALVALVAERSVLIVRGGVLSGGHLLPMPPGARDLWAAYAGAWHDSVVGSAAPSPPSTGALALLSTLLLGKPWLAVDVLLLASVPLAGATAYVASGRLSRHLTLRIWAAATWALLPVATGAVAAGRLDSAAVQVGLPPLLVGAGRLLVSQPRTTGWWRAWGVGLGLAVLAAFAPLLWPLLGGGLVLAAAVRFHRSPAGALACLLPALVPLALLVPWS